MTNLHEFGEYGIKVCCHKKMRKSQTFIDCEGLKVSYKCDVCKRMIVIKKK